MLEDLLKKFRHNELFWFMKELLSCLMNNCDEVESLKKDVAELKEQVLSSKAKPVKAASKTASVPTTKKSTKKD